MLVATGDGAFLMNSQEIETALRLRLPIVILIWVDDAYGLISWKMDLEIGHNVDTAFGNPDFVAYAESFGARGYRIGAAGELLPTLQAALADDTVSVIACPVDYSRQRRAHPPRSASSTRRSPSAVFSRSPPGAGVPCLLPRRSVASLPRSSLRRKGRALWLAGGLPRSSLRWQARALWLAGGAAGALG